MPRVSAGQRYRRIFETAPDAILLVDSDSGEIVDANPAAVEMLGYSAQDLVGKTFPCLMKDTAAAQGIWGEMQSSDKTWHEDVTLEHLSAQPLRAEIRACAVKDAGARRLHIQLRQLDRASAGTWPAPPPEAHRIDAARTISAALSHDLNNMLTTVLGYCELLLLSQPADSGIRKDLEQIQKAANQSAALTKQLAAFAGRQSLQAKLLSPGEVIGRMKDTLELLLGDRVRLQIENHANGAKIKVDPAQLEQAVANLVVNGRDAMGEGGVITIRLSTQRVGEEITGGIDFIPPGSYLVLAVADGGTGIDPAIRHRIFEPFFTTKPKGLGKGLGLSVVYGLVRQSGGWTRVNSEPGRGTTFELYFPNLSEPTPAESRSKAVKHAHGKTVLLVEDLAAVRMITREVLKHAGFEVLDADCGSAALKLAAKHDGQIDVMLTDVVMPDLSGQDLAVRIASTRPQMKVVFMSGYPEEDVIRRGSLRQGTAFIQKPFTPDVLVERIRKVIND